MFGGAVVGPVSKLSAMACYFMIYSLPRSARFVVTEMRLADVIALLNAALRRGVSIVSHAIARAEPVTPIPTFQPPNRT